LQNKDQTISNLTAENDHLTSALNAAEQRVNELYAEQSRSEVELAQRIDISDKLRTQVRELEKEKREIQRRYKEQASVVQIGTGTSGLRCCRQQLSKQSARRSTTTSNTSNPAFCPLRSLESNRNLTSLTLSQNLKSSPMMRKKYRITIEQNTCHAGIFTIQRQNLPR
jgi:chromosome segregation ATPase